jgi:hypothetical protein
LVELLVVIAIIGMLIDGTSGTFLVGEAIHATTVGRAAGWPAATA